MRSVVGPRSRTILALAVCCLLTLGVGVAAAHQFVTFGQRPVTADSDGTARVPVNVHETDIAVLRLATDSGLTLTVELVDGDRDGRLTVVLDLAAVARDDLDAGVTVESGEAVSRRVGGATGEFPTGRHNLTLSTPNGVGDETTLVVSETAAVTPTATATAPPTATADETGAAATATATERTVSGGATTTAAESGARGVARASFPAFLLALFGPAVPVLLLAVAARVFG